MAKRIRIDGAVDLRKDGTPKVVRVARRRPRPGERRGTHLTFVDDYLAWLERRAVKERTRVAEVVMDLIDLARKRGPGEAAAAGDAA